MYPLIIKKIYHTLCLCILGLISFGVTAAQEDIDNELNEYIEEFKKISEAKSKDKFNAAKTEIKELVQKLEWSGISDVSLFDLVQQDFLSTCKSAKKENVVEYCSWLIMALARSGQSKYEGDIFMLRYQSPNAKLQRHAGTSMNLLPKHKKWNPEISKDLALVSRAEFESKRLINMLESSDFELAKAGANYVIVHRINNKQVLEVLKDLVMKDYRVPHTDYYEVERITWFCRALGSAGDKDYMPVLEEIAKDVSASQPVFRWANKAIQMIKHPQARHSSDREEEEEEEEEY